MKKKVIKIIARIRFWYRWNFDLARDARLAIIQYSMQELT